MVQASSSPRPLLKQGGGVTELYCNTTESFSNSSPYIGYRRMITFPSNYKEVEIEAYGQNVYNISTQHIQFEFSLSQSSSSTIFHRRNTIINLSATSFDSYISRSVMDSSSGRMSVINESLTDLMPSTDYFIIRGKIFPQNATNDAMIFAGTMTSMSYLIHLYYEVNEKLTNFSLYSLERDNITSNNIVLRATCYS